MQLTAAIKNFHSALCYSISGFVNAERTGLNPNTCISETYNILLYLFNKHTPKNLMLLCHMRGPLFKTNDVIR